MLLYSCPEILVKALDGKPTAPPTRVRVNNSYTSTFFVNVSVYNMYRYDMCTEMYEC